jgi:hypothetical protein
VSRGYKKLQRDISMHRLPRSTSRGNFGTVQRRPPRRPARRAGRLSTLLRVRNGQLPDNIFYSGTIFDEPLIEVSSLHRRDGTELRERVPLEKYPGKNWRVLIRRGGAMKPFPGSR